MGILQKIFRRAPEKKRPFVSAVVVAAGRSGRMAGNDKLFAPLGGAPLLAHSLAAFQSSSLVDEIIVVARSEIIAEVGELCKTRAFTKVTCILTGGETRQESVEIGLSELHAASELVAIHDGARPLVTREIIDETIEAAAKYGAAIPAIPVKDTIKRAENGAVAQTVARDALYAAQTPQVFKTELIRAGLASARQKNLVLTDDSMAVELLGVPVRLVPGASENIKVTVPADLCAAEALLTQK